MLPGSFSVTSSLLTCTYSGTVSASVVFQATGPPVVTVSLSAITSGTWPTLPASDSMPAGTASVTMPAATRLVVLPPALCSASLPVPEVIAISPWREVAVPQRLMSLPAVNAMVSLNSRPPALMCPMPASAVGVSTPLLSSQPATIVRPP